MATKIKTSPRKRPLQERSRKMVDHIVEATARVLTHDGYEGTTTNRVAEVAGVSVGSLYQYFPSKESLVAAVIDRHSDEMMTVYRTAIAGAVERPLPEAARIVIEAMVDAHQVNPALHRVCVEQIPRVGKLGRLLEDLDTHASKPLIAFLSAQREGLTVEDVELATFIVVHSVETVLHRTLTTRRAIERDRLVNELCALCLRYLTGRAPSERASDGDC